MIQIRAATGGRGSDVVVSVQLSEASLADREIQDALAALVLPKAEWPACGTRAGEPGDERVSRCGREASGMLESAVETASLEEEYALAEGAFAKGAIQEACDRLLALGEHTRAAPISLALAICAARLARFEEADDFARVSLHVAPRNPRALCVRGICALVSGDKAEAQARLALAARLARGQEEFREDMRSAQKLLLIRHFALEIAEC